MIKAFGNVTAKVCINSNDIIIDILSPRDFSRTPNGHFPERKYGSSLEVLTGCVFDGYDVMIPGHHGTIEMVSLGKSVLWKSWADNTLFMKRGAVGVFLNYNDHSKEIPGHLLQRGKLIIGSKETKPADLAVISYATD